MTNLDKLEVTVIRTTAGSSKVEQIQPFEVTGFEAEIFIDQISREVVKVIVQSASDIDELIHLAERFSSAETLAEELEGRGVLFGIFPIIH